MHYSIDHSIKTNWMSLSKTTSISIEVTHAQKESSWLIKFLRALIADLPQVQPILESIRIEGSLSNNNQTINNCVPLLNIRGRPQITIEDETYKGLSQDDNSTMQEELLYLSGKIAHPPLSFGIDESDLSVEEELRIPKLKRDYEITPFDYRVVTTFSSYKNRRTIEYLATLAHSSILSIVKSGATLEQLLSSNMASPNIINPGTEPASSISLSSFRFGCDLFKGRTIFYALGAQPTIEQQLYIEANENIIKIGWWQHAPLGSKNNKRASNNIIIPACCSLENIIGNFGLIDEVNRRLASS